MKVITLLACMLSVGCMAEVSSEDYSDGTMEYHSNSEWSPDSMEVPICRPLVRQVHMNGETVTIVEPAQCPFLNMEPPPYDEIPSEGIVINPYDESTFDIQKGSHF